VVGAGHVWACMRVVPELRGRVTWRSDLLRPLVSFGGWLTVSSIISPVMVYADRFLIGAVISVAAVAYYATPFDMISKLLVIPIALASVLFPAFATTHVSDPDRTAMLFSRAVNYVFILIYPMVLLAVAFAPEAMRLWLGPQFAAHSSTVLRLLAAGILVNSLAQIPVAVIQGGGRPDITAKLHMLELPLFVIALWFAVRAYGITGAATVWAVRVAVDALLLYVMAERLLPGASHYLKRGALLLAAALASLCAIPLVGSLPARAGIVLAVIATLTWATWSRIFDGSERRLVRTYLGMVTGLWSRRTRPANAE